jgi:hypothetical protein
MAATNEDALLMVQLMRWGTEMGLTAQVSHPSEVFDAPRMVAAIGRVPGCASVGDACTRGYAALTASGPVTAGCARPHIRQPRKTSPVAWSASRTSPRIFAGCLIGKARRIC